MSFLGKRNYGKTISITIFISIIIPIHWWEWDCNIPSWAQPCFKKSFLAPKNCTFQVGSKTRKKYWIRLAIIILFYCSYILRQNEGGWMILMLFLLFVSFLNSQLQTTTYNQQDVFLKPSQHKIDCHTFNCRCNFQCWLLSLKLICWIFLLLM